VLGAGTGRSIRQIVKLGESRRGTQLPVEPWNSAVPLVILGCVVGVGIQVSLRASLKLNLLASAGRLEPGRKSATGPAKVHLAALGFSWTFLDFALVPDHHIGSIQPSVSYLQKSSSSATRRTGSATAVPQDRHRSTPTTSALLQGPSFRRRLEGRQSGNLQQ
jgi:hypothetical protein